MPMAFPSADPAVFAAIPEIEIETSDPESGTVHRAIIWVVGIGDHLFARSYRGATARWYREARDGRPVRLIAGDRAIAAIAVPVSDPGLVAAVSIAYRAKYADDPSMPAMVRPDVLDTTIRLEAPPA